MTIYFNNRVQQGTIVEVPGYYEPLRYYEPQYEQWPGWIEPLPLLPRPIWKGTAPWNIAVRFHLWNPWRLWIVLWDDIILFFAFMPRRWWRRRRAVRHKGPLRNFCKLA